MVEPAANAPEGPMLEQQLIQWCRDRLAHYKCPRQILFDPALPREPTGKLLKKALRERYLDIRMPESALRR
ncbi:MAG: hypothetical protein ABW164_11865 [Sphingobium sp.]